MRTIDLHASRQSFEALRQAQPDLRPFRDPGAVLDRLHRRDDDAAAKNRILVTLVQAAQGGTGARDVAVTLVWLALWPGLDALYRRLWRHFAATPEDLVSEIAGRFTTTLHRLDATRVRRIAATLLLNVERDIRTHLRAQWAEAARRVAPPETGTVSSIDVWESVLGLPAGIDANAAAVRIRALLMAVVGEDADLVVAVTILGAGQREIADRLGIGHDAARKRCQRALRRLRRALEKD